MAKNNILLHNENGITQLKINGIEIFQQGNDLMKFFLVGRIGTVNVTSQLLQLSIKVNRGICLCSDYGVFNGGCVDRKRWIALPGLIIIVFAQVVTAFVAIGKRH